tara:strand:- start:1533 stop:1775 length:243 start_codon:yes stop_codon:yes gene_type:complete
MIEIFIVMIRATTDEQAAGFGGKAAGDWVPFRMTTSLKSAHDMSYRMKDVLGTFTKVQSVLCDDDGHLSAMGLPAPLPVE